jgi:SAM-dependent methyltransferase
MSGPASWARFFGGRHSIYVNETHLKAHSRRVADDLLALLGERPGARLLDFGCGEALEAERLAGAVGQLLLYDGSEEIVARLKARYGDAPGIAVLDRAGLDALPAESLDVIVVVSVIQYLKAEDLAALLARWHALLKPGGELIVADVVPPETNPFDDVLTLLGAGLAHGFFWAALFGLFATFFSDYRRLRCTLGFARYRVEEFHALLQRYGFRPEVASRNVGFSRSRRTFRGRKT